MVVYNYQADESEYERELDTEKEKLHVILKKETAHNEDEM